MALKCPSSPSSKPSLRTPAERGTDEDEMQVEFGDLHSTVVDYFCRKKKCLPFHFLASFLLFQKQRTEHFGVSLHS